MTSCKDKGRNRDDAPPDSIARSAALLEVAGFTVIEPLHPIREVWHLVAHSAQHPGLMLVGVFAAPPDPSSPRLWLPGRLSSRHPDPLLEAGRGPA